MTINRDHLFRELTDATAMDRYLEGWSEFGQRVLVGNSQVRDPYSMATSFFQAAEELRKIVLAKLGLHLFRYEYPMFFLYRHAIELYLKSVLPEPKRGHNLERLVDDFVEYMEKHYAINVSKGWFVDTLREFSRIDPSAQSFRYPSDLSGNPTIPGDFFVNIKQWGETMEKVGGIFDHLHVLQWKDEPKADIPTSSRE